MTEIVSRLTEVENLLRHLPAAKRTMLLKAITDLFLENVDRYGPAQIVLFDRLFTQLVADAGKESTAALSRRLAPIANAPASVVSRLAQDDDISIAEPVLARSPCVEDETLLSIARSKGQTHLLAIACRPQLIEAVVDLLVARGDAIVARYIANNLSAHVSDASAAILVERARDDEMLAALVDRRNDIPPRLRLALRCVQNPAAEGTTAA